MGRDMTLLQVPVRGTMGSGEERPREKRSLIFIVSVNIGRLDHSKLFPVTQNRLETHVENRPNRPAAARVTSDLHSPLKRPPTQRPVRGVPDAAQLPQRILNHPA